jgi:hypothetical protein
MKLKSLNVVLMTCLLSITSNEVLAEKQYEKMPESPAFRAARIEKDVNDLFGRATRMAAVELANASQVKPFAMIKKADDTWGVFRADATEKNKALSINDQVASIRKLLIELAKDDQIKGSALVMYASVSEQGKSSVKHGLSYEIEHIEGVSLIRFLPVSYMKDENGKKTDELQFELNQITTEGKPKIVFAGISPQ